MSSKSRNFIYVLIVLLFTSCVSVNSEPGAGNKQEYAVPTYTPRPIPTPSSKSESGEFTLLLRKRIAPYELVILRLPIECLLSGEVCDLNGNLLGVLPQSLSQILKIYWTNNGDRAFFWDDIATNIYILDGNQGTFQIFKKEILKVRDDFLISPDGENTIFEIQKSDSDNETDLVLMNNLSGDISTFDIPLPGAKYASQWLDDHTVLFWDEISEGKGYLVDRKVYTINTLDQSVQPFDIGYDWMQTSVPIFSPDRKFMAFTTQDTTIIRDASGAFEHTWNMKSEKFLWSMDSSFLAMYDSNGEIYMIPSNGSELQKIYSLAAIGNLEDWMWLPDNKHIILIVVDDDGNRQIRVLSVVDKTFTPINSSLLNDYDPISFSFRP